MQASSLHLGSWKRHSSFPKGRTLLLRLSAWMHTHMHVSTCVAGIGSGLHTLRYLIVSFLDCIGKWTRGLWREQMLVCLMPDLHNETVLCSFLFFPPSFSQICHNTDWHNAWTEFKKQNKQLFHKKLKTTLKTGAVECQGAKLPHSHSLTKSFLTLFVYTATLYSHTPHNFLN